MQLRGQRRPGRRIRVVRVCRHMGVRLTALKGIVDALVIALIDHLYFRIPYIPASPARRITVRIFRQRKSRFARVQRPSPVA